MLKSNTYFNIKWLIAALIFTAAILFLTHLPQEIIPPQLEISGLDKLAHIFAYGAITFLFLISLRSPISLLASMLLFFAILAVGTLDELTQPFFNRSASLTDWLANIIGASGVLLFFLRFKHPRYQSTLTTQYPTPEC